MLRYLVVLVAVLVVVTPYAAALAETPSEGRYGAFSLLDHRSRYGQGWFPEPLRTDETDVDNEVRFDWTHAEGNNTVGDEAKVEIEKSFNLLTIEIEGGYERESVFTVDSDSGLSGHEREEGLSNVEISARHPIWQYVSENEFIDNTVGVAFELALPTNTAVSKNTEVVPVIFDALRLGEHFSVQTIVGWSFLLGPDPEGGEQTLEYAMVFGYSLDHHEVPIPGVEQIIPIFEVQGETGLNKDDSGHNILTGTLGLRANLIAIGSIQARLGAGWIFPIDQGARDEFDWGFVTSLVFEF